MSTEDDVLPVVPDYPPMEEGCECEKERLIKKTEESKEADAALAENTKFKKDDPTILEGGKTTLPTEVVDDEQEVENEEGDTWTA
jgi:exoribonuclease II